jgi:outer membrane protein assembly factor BamD (BamD/ComL family)
MADARDTVVRAAIHPRRSAVRLVRAIRHAATPRQTDPQQLDVWSRTQPKYRRRAVILLLLNSVLFAGLGCFAFWLRTGQFIPFLADDYWHLLWRTFNPAAEQQVTLIDFLIAPINVQQAPMQIVVLGLLLASLVSVPILVAMLYRLPYAFIFIPIVAFVAMFPWLALTITLSCILTRLPALRFSFRYATALIGLIPVALYFYNATRNPPPAAAYTTGIDNAALYAPWLLAMLASCLVMAVVLLTARLVNYRPGAIAPLMAVMFTAPVVLFEAKVGRDELYYRFLENDYGPHSTSCFRDQDASAIIHDLAVRKQADEAREAAQSDKPKPGRSVPDIEQEIKTAWAYWLDPYNAADDQLNLFQLQQYQAVQACDRFRDDFPRSEYLPNVLFIKGRALDMRIDIETFRRDGGLHYYQDFPNQVSASTWTTLYEQYPDSPAACVALYRSAQLEARAGRIDHALSLLDRLIDRFGPAQTTAPASPPRVVASLEKPPPTSTLDIQVKAVVHDARRFRDLLRLNRDPQLAAPPDILSDAPLVEFLRCDPRHRLYTQNLRELLAKYPFSRLRDNLILEQALSERSTSLRIDVLNRFIRMYEGRPDADVVPEAEYRLGETYLRDSRSAEARAAFEAVLKNYADSVWAEEAQKQVTLLTALGVATQAKEKWPNP